MKNLKKILQFAMIIAITPLFNGCEREPTVSNSNTTVETTTNKNIQDENLVFEIPTGQNDLILAYTRVGNANSNPEAYLISIGGTVLHLKFDDDLKEVTAPDFLYLDSCIKSGEHQQIKVEPLSKPLLEKISKINPVDFYVVPNVIFGVFPLPENIYWIAQKSDGEHVPPFFYAIKGEWFLVDFISSVYGKTNNSPYTDEIRAYIDYAVAEADKAGL